MGQKATEPIRTIEKTNYGAAAAKKKYEEDKKIEFIKKMKEKSR